MRRALVEEILNLEALQKLSGAGVGAESTGSAPASQTDRHGVVAGVPSKLALQRVAEQPTGAAPKRQRTERPAGD